MRAGEGPTISPAHWHRAKLEVTPLRCEQECSRLLVKELGHKWKTFSALFFANEKCVAQV
jgi:hypothetical protein